MGELARPSVVAEILERHGLRLTRALGQHFLIDGNVLRRLVETADLGGGETALEIGPGIGTLTEELCARARRVVAVEMDRRLLAVLDETLGSRPNLEVIEGDAMHVDFAPLFSAGEKVKVVSNLPYNVATPLILRLLTELPQAGGMVVTVQRELAERYMAKPGSAAYGGVSVKMRLFCDIRRIAHIPPTVFLPQPRVESAILRIDRRVLPASDLEVDPFFLFLNASFGARRKMMVNSLSGGRAPYCTRPSIEEALRATGLSTAARAEELSCEELLAVFRELSSRMQ
jgi:16S rRNA (adenine1518-N6/adenine1519-N6)-dimethyltransferase